MQDKDKSLNFLIWFSIFIPITYMIYYLMTDMQLSVNGDTNLHIETAKQWIKGEITFTYPGWHTLLLFFAYLCNYSIKGGAILANFTFGILSYAVCVWIATWFFDIKKYGATSVYISILMMFVGPLIYMPWYCQKYLLEHGISFNIWHSSTHGAVKFISILIIFLFIRTYRSYENNPLSTKWGKYIVCGVLTAFSALLKPSFIQVFLPALGLFLLYELIKSKQSFLYLFKIGMCFLPAAIIILVQYLLIYMTGESNSDGGSVAIEVLTVWRAFTPNIWASIILSLAFPLFVYGLHRKEISNNKYFLFTLIFLVVSILEFGILCETGIRKYNGNFMWGYSLAIGASFLICIIYFIKYCLNESVLDLRKKINVGIGTVLLTSHFIWGVWYYLVLIINRAAQRA